VYTLSVEAKRILVADDDPKFLHLVSEVLTGAGYDVRTASDPTKVAEMAEQLRPELVILDISMPGRNGFEVARELHDHAQTKGVKCMFVTAYREPTQVKRAKEAGGIGYLEKPFRTSSLIWMVKTLLSKRPLEPELP